VIVPDPPGYKSCLAQARKKLPSLKKASAKTLLATCKQVFRTREGLDHRQGHGGQQA
jgi:hypothetical protein